ncbi:MAG: hypothetical protein JSR82_17585 [Verrucomicrobia bacterium]|nr:hypothetical protein [Verrucomicrobiota bacterium]
MEPNPAPPGATRKLLFRVGFLVLAVTLLLEIWRPWFYLEDDNFTSYMPGMHEFSRRLWSGQNPFLNEHIFGGRYNMLADPSVFGALSPWLPLVSLLALTPASLWLTDVMSLCNSWAIALSFAWAALWLRQRGHHRAPDWLIVALSLSYAFTPYNLLIGSSWIGFLNGQATLPLVIVGLFSDSNRRAILLMAGALLYALFGGHAHTFVIASVFSGLLGLLVAWRLRSMRPLVRLLAAGGLAALCILPLLWPTLAQFQASPRGAGLPSELAARGTLALWPLASSYLFGPLAAGWLGGIGLHGADPVFNLGIAFSGVGLLAIAATASGLRPGNSHPLTLPLLVCFLLAALLIVRPSWLAGLISHLPVLRSLQWPFREIWLLLFISHFLLLLHWQHLHRAPAIMAGSISALGLALVPLNEPPALYPFTLDRSLVFSGEAERYWSTVRARLGPKPQVVSSLDPRFLLLARPEIPFSLLGGYTFGSLYGFVSVSGYTFTSGLRAEEAGPRPYFFSGCYFPPDAKRMAELNPAAWVIELHGLRPARWSLSRGSERFGFLFDPATGTVKEDPTFASRP